MTQNVTPGQTHDQKPKVLRWSVVFFTILIYIGLAAAVFFAFVRLNSMVKNLMSEELGIIDAYVDKVANFVYFVLGGVVIVFFTVLDGHKWKIWTAVPRGLNALFDATSRKMNVLDKTSEEDFKEGRKDGAYREYYPNGQIKRQAPYAAGKMHGIYREYYPSGQLKKEVVYAGGKMDGVFQTFYETGQKEQEAIYRKGVLDGTYRSFYEDGIPHQIKQYINGKLNGIYKAIDERGFPFFEITFKDDVQHGSDKIFDQEGVLRYWDTYIDGIRVNRKTYNQFGALKYDHYFEEAIQEVKTLMGEGQVVEREREEKAKRIQQKRDTSREDEEAEEE